MVCVHSYGDEPDVALSMCICVFYLSGHLSFVLFFSFDCFCLFCFFLLRVCNTVTSPLKYFICIL